MIGLLVLLPIMMLVSFLLIADVAAAAAATANNNNELPRGFVMDEMARVKAITGTFAPNPRASGKNNNNNLPEMMLLLSAKEGLITVMEDPDTNPTNIITIADLSDRLCTNGERGIQTIRPSPNFKNDRHLFLYYSVYTEGCTENVVTGPPNRLSRFTMDRNTLELDLNSEKILLETSPTAKRMHNGGSIQFGNDGKLWLSTGEGSSTSNRELDYSQSMNVLHGKILRLNPDGSIPDDNPYAGSNNNKAHRCHKRGGQTTPDRICSEIWATGLRNPFRMVMDESVTDRVVFRVGDVGAAVWEEINPGGTDYKNVNYGWNDMEGPCKRNSNTDCTVKSTLKQNGKNYQDPMYYYEHRKAENGGAVVGMAYVPTDLDWPHPYHHFLFIDFVFSEIYSLIRDDDQECRRCQPPVPGYRNATLFSLDGGDDDNDDEKDDHNMIDMFFGPYQQTQALYIVSRGPGMTLRRIRYNSDSQNRSPTAKVRIRDSVVEDENYYVFSVQEEIRFDGRQSSDPDDDDNNDSSLTYHWDFGDGTIIAPNPKGRTRPTHSYDQKGQYTITLTVTDEKGLTDSDTISVQIGMPPLVTMESPTEGSTFAVGQVLRLVGSATDNEGNVLLLDDNDSNKNRISWEVRQHHADHWHPFFLGATTQNQNNFDLYPAPEPEDLYAATNSYLEIRLTVTDSDGLSTLVTRNIQPQIVMVTIESDPPSEDNVELLLDESVVTTPATITSWENHNLLLEYIDDNDDEYIFDSWKTHDGSETSHEKQHQTRISSDENHKIVAVFAPPPTRAPTHEPTRVPTPDPTTRAPTREPTRAPTRAPTREPTPDPTQAPTETKKLPDEEGSSSIQIPDFLTDPLFVSKYLCGHDDASNATTSSSSSSSNDHHHLQDMTNFLLSNRDSPIYILEFVTTSDDDENDEYQSFLQSLGDGSKLVYSMTRSSSSSNSDSDTEWRSSFPNNDETTTTTTMEWNHGYIMEYATADDFYKLYLNHPQLSKYHSTNNNDDDHHPPYTIYMATKNTDGYQKYPQLFAAPPIMDTTTATTTTREEVSKREEQHEEEQLLFYHGIQFSSPNGPSLMDIFDTMTEHNKTDHGIYAQAWFNIEAKLKCGPSSADADEDGMMDQFRLETISSLLEYNQFLQGMDHVAYIIQEEGLTSNSFSGIAQLHTNNNDANKEEEEEVIGTIIIDNHINDVEEIVSISGAADVLLYGWWIWSTIAAAISGAFICW